jgi:hypothetical protein
MMASHWPGTILRKVWTVIRGTVFQFGVAISFRTVDLNSHWCTILELIRCSISSESSSHRKISEIL